jgi:glutaredoxin
MDMSVQRGDHHGCCYDLAAMPKKPSKFSVILYGRAGCHLCDGARSLLLRLESQLDFELHEIDIDTDADLLARYDAAVPVVVAGNTELARAPLDARQLELRLRNLLAGR